ncbi:hypothetical protein [Streptomyces phaeolivaceus]|uniref:hypothetical protein n=1 Tax=Streptomyces phaeolivaceus TaxID=2653200 RepID=UPI0018699670|nr:hypothetical protein [Streptomyces phaeolivaceus]
MATTSYSQAAVLFTTGGSHTSAQIHCWKDTGGTGAGNRDDPAVERLSSATDAVTDPGFETGALTRWSQSTGTASSVAASSGTCLLAGWAKAATAGEEVAVGVKGFGGTETYLRTSATAYAQQPVFFTTGASVTSAQAYRYKNSGSAAGYCDDLTVVKLP